MEGAPRAGRARPQPEPRVAEPREDYAALDPAQAAARIKALEQQMYQHARDPSSRKRPGSATSCIACARPLPFEVAVFRTNPSSPAWKGRSKKPGAGLQFAREGFQGG